MRPRRVVAGNPHGYTVYTALLVAALCGCGRFGVHLVPQAGTASDGGVCVGDSCALATCDDPSSSPSTGVCGCGSDANGDSDGDGVPDCLDFCPGIADQGDAGRCACRAAEGDADQDGVHNCFDRCPFDGMKAAPGLCGCGISDADDDLDNTPNCQDDCPDDPDKTQPGRCGCGQSEQDTDLDGTPDCMDRCNGRDDASYTPSDDCGTGYCREHNTPSSCVQGLETACMAGPPASSQDTSCDGVDDDCDGQNDEEYPGVATTCGKGACAATGRTSCVAGSIVDSCEALAAAGTEDATCDDRDDDCDGRIDEDVAPVASVCMGAACSMTGTGVIACVGGALVDSCDAMVPTAPDDTTCDNLDDDCDGRIDEDFTAAATSCGVGECARMGVRTCVAGSLTDSCMAASPTSTTDTDCNGLDDDCDGQIDEEFVSTATSCGLGACISAGSLTCVLGATQNSCTEKTPVTTVDDATAPGNNVDDDCDGKVDEDVPACDTTPRTYEVGAYNNIAVPGNCQNVSVRLWGGGGASGQTVSTAVGGDGGAGGYATANVLASGTIDLYVGGGAAAGCSAAGINAGSASYDGGSGGMGNGADGGDGSASGGGSGGTPSAGADGGNGHYGGGGGGEAGGATVGSGDGGGGGAASVFLVNGMRVAFAGGGGGGGGALYLLGGLVEDAGGNGGSGCRGNGQVATSNGGGGGGGGACLGVSTQAGAGTVPAFATDLPSGRARGGAGSCMAGGGGYAIVTFAP